MAPEDPRLPMARMPPPALALMAAGLASWQTPP